MLSYQTGNAMGTPTPESIRMIYQIDETFDIYVDGFRMLGPAPGSFVSSLWPIYDNTWYLTPASYHVIAMQVTNVGSSRHVAMAYFLNGLYLGGSDSQTTCRFTYSNVANWTQVSFNDSAWALWGPSTACNPSSNTQAAFMLQSMTGVPSIATRWNGVCAANGPTDIMYIRCYVGKNMMFI
jgi:hypothetical protein